MMTIVNALGMSMKACSASISMVICRVSGVTVKKVRITGRRRISRMHITTPIMGTSAMKRCPSRDAPASSPEPILWPMRMAQASESPRMSTRKSWKTVLAIWTEARAPVPRRP